MPQKLVLVVEDEANIREMMQTMLEDFFGARTIPAENGLQALQLAREWLPSLILLDIMLPGVDGFEVASRLKSSSQTREIPIVAVTASTSPERALAVGCDDYIPKPFDLDFFLGKLQPYLLGSLEAAAC